MPSSAQHVARIGDQRDQRRHVARRPGARHQRLARRALVGRGADQADHLVDIGDGDGEADLDMRAVARLVEQILGAPRDDLLAEVEEGDQHVACSVIISGLPPFSAIMLAPKLVCIGGEAPQLVEHHVGDRVALQLDDDAHAVAVGSRRADREMPSMRLSRTSSAIFSISVALLT